MSPESQSFLVEVVSEASARLAEIARVAFDLEQAEANCHAAARELQKGLAADPLVADALCRATLFQYARAWDGSRPHGVVAAIRARFSPAIDAVHKVAKDMRDKHFAHATGRHSEFVVLARVEAAVDGRVTVTGLQTDFKSLSAPSIGFLHSLSATIREQILMVDAELVREKESLASTLNAMGAESIKAMKRVNPPTVLIRRR